MPPPFLWGGFFDIRILFRKAFVSGGFFYLAREKSFLPKRKPGGIKYNVPFSKGFYIAKAERFFGKPSHFFARKLKIFCKLSE